MLIPSKDVIRKVVLFRDSDFHFRMLRSFTKDMTGTKEGNLLALFIASLFEEKFVECVGCLNFT